MTELKYRNELELRLSQFLPGATLAIQTLPQVPVIRLQLLADTMSARQLPHEVAARVMEDPLYWVFCWASGQVLASWLLQDTRRVKGKRVLDFGSGSGVVAIAAARAGAHEVIACDCDPLARTAIAANAKLNGVDLTVAADFEEVSGELDLLVAADVLYDADNLSLLSAFTKRASSVLVADSRVRNFQIAPYRKIHQADSRTLPDLGESAEFNRVSLYEAIDDEPGNDEPANQEAAT